MCKKRLPPIHPGEILREGFMKPLNLSTNALTQRLGVTAARVITAGTALRLARCFSTTPEFWMNLQQRCEFEGARRAIGSVERKVVALDLAG